MYIKINTKIRKNCCLKKKQDVIRRKAKLRFRSICFLDGIHTSILSLHFLSKNAFCLEIFAHQCTSVNITVNKDNSKEWIVQQNQPVLTCNYSSNSFKFFLFYNISITELIIQSVVLCPSVTSREHLIIFDIRIQFETVELRSLSDPMTFLLLFLFTVRLSPWLVKQPTGDKLQILLQKCNHLTRSESEIRTKGIANMFAVIVLANVAYKIKVCVLSFFQIRSLSMANLLSQYFGWTRPLPIFPCFLLFVPSAASSSAFVFVF